MLVDSNILVYSINKSSLKHKRAQEFLLENAGNLEIAHQNIFETLRVLTHPKLPKPVKVSDALESIEGILKGCKIVNPDYRTHRIAIELIRKYRLAADKVFDAYLAATAISNDISVVATDNTKDFRFSELTTVNPFKTAT